MLYVGEGQFAVFFPHDGHQPGIAVAPAEESEVRKVVVKVLL
jgi:YhcH/YjgK/YiaL family protein